MVVACLTVLALVACDAGPRAQGPPQGPTVTELAALDAAVARLDAARATPLAEAGLIGAAGSALDEADEAFVSGDRRRAAESRRLAAAAQARAKEALAALPRRLAEYRSALAGLEQAVLPLAPARREAVAAAVAAGEREAAALEGFGEAARELLAAHAALDTAQTTWLKRASAGWYRNRAEAAAAYVVLRRPHVAALDEARARLGAADQARVAAGEETGRRLAAADAALAPLREPAELPG